MIKWEIKGREFGNCNCDYGCPCQFNALPTHGHCRGLAVLDIEKGFHGSTRLDGLRAAAIFRWPGPIHEGNGEGVQIIDKRATPEQREALLHRRARIPSLERQSSRSLPRPATRCTSRLSPTSSSNSSRRSHRARPDRWRAGDPRRSHLEPGHRRRAPGTHRAAERF